MLERIRGLHHVTSMASDAQVNNRFFTKVLGLRRVKKTVNFDAPEIYHLYYADERGTPGTVMTYFPFPGIAPRRRGTGEVGMTVFAVPAGTLDWWANWLGEHGVAGIEQETRFGEMRLRFLGPDEDEFALAEVGADSRAPWTGADIPADCAICGFHSVSLRLNDAMATGELLSLMGYEEEATDGHIRRLRRPHGNEAAIVDIETVANGVAARQGAGSVHHVAFEVDTRETEEQVRRALLEEGFAVTPVIDRDYFFSIYFRSPGGVLFEIATAEPGFTRDEDLAELGTGLRLPRQHAHLRPHLERHLPPIDD